MATVFLICVLHCCTQVRTPDSQWTKQDKAALETAQTHCRAKHECLVRFKKVEEGLYNAVCGKENN